jgi:hypothetical protein
MCTNHRTPLYQDNPTLYTLVPRVRQTLYGVQRHQQQVLSGSKLTYYFTAALFYLLSGEVHLSFILRDGTGSVSVESGH